MIQPTRPVLGAIAVVCEERDGAPHVVLVQRAKDPNRGYWGFPGGHVELGETLSDAAVRELGEETGVVAAPIETLRLLDVIDHNSDQTIRSHYVLGVIMCRFISGEVVAQDDAADARWFSVEELQKSTLPLLAQVAEVADEAALKQVQARADRTLS